MRDYWCEDTKISPYLPTYTLKPIASFVLIRDKAGDDLGWMETPSGKLSVKSALALLRNERNMIYNPMWRWVWHFKVPQRIKLFTWILPHDKLLTNTTRARRHLTTDPSCRECGASLEDSEHILRFCLKARDVWASLKAIGLDFVFDELNFMEWLIHNIRGSYADRDWSTKFLMTLWYLWKWRCLTCLNDSRDIPRSKGKFLLVRFTEIIRAFEKEDLTRKRNQEPACIEQLVRWESPPGGWVALNSDGAAKGNPGLAAAGGVLRDHKGKWLMGFTENLGRCTSMKAEI
ncbi:hypothetical protein Cgig2_010780 [Carnegiea gigantea]|uniref:RNase H type-1 domain-containing protein n=1 Tax=Carnegiea gigantea TaxID=171969 RepID=A0A9Q1JHY9_9CARY|nr:hypothetical protein Cgig2_010780 [Carnegiea gigantea]